MLLKDVLVILLTVIGGLGTFLLGMKHLSEGLQAVSGSGLRKFMALATTHRLAGIATGCVSTVIVQSSSIITVMTVGLVSTGILTLQQAINVIVGSNIGTTTTAWLIAFVPDVGLLGLGVISVGMVLYFFFKKERAHNLGLALMGLGLIFMGLYWMNKGVEPVKHLDDVKRMFMALDAKTFAGLARCILVSLVFTAVVQSSAATTAIAMTLAQQGLITFETAAATVFGMNIGTTVTAWLAAVGSTTDARRAALAHSLFNVCGTLLLLPFFLPVLLPFTLRLFPNYARAVNMPDGSISFPFIMAPMAFIHTAFNLATTLFFFPFIRPFSRMVSWMIPAKKKELPRLTFLDTHIKQTPVIACAQAFREVSFMGDSDLELLSTIRTLLSGEENTSLEEHVFHREVILDSVQREITEFLGHVMTARLPADVAGRARMLLRVTDELESVSDEAPIIVKVLRRMRMDQRWFPDATLKAVLYVHDAVSSYGEKIVDAFKQSDSVSPADALITLKVDAETIHRLIHNTRQQQLEQIGPNSGTPMGILVTLDILNAYNRIKENFTNVSDALLGGKK